MTSTETTLLVVGGEGTVGRLVGTEPLVVCRKRLAASRTFERACRFAGSVRATQALAFEVSDEPCYAGVLAEAGTVVMWLDRDATGCGGLSRVQHRLRGPLADGLVCSRDWTLDDIAREHGATAVLSLGLSPGTTNRFVPGATAEFRQFRPGRHHRVSGSR